MECGQHGEGTVDTEKVQFTQVRYNTRMVRMHQHVEGTFNMWRVQIT